MSDPDRGRLLTTAVAAWIGAVPMLVVLSALLLRRPPLTVWITILLRSAPNYALAWFLWRAHRWARWTAIIVLIGGAFIPLRPWQIAYVFVSQGRIIPAMVFAMPKTILLCAGLILWLSPSVLAFFDRENRTTALRLSEPVV